MIRGIAIVNLDFTAPGLSCAENRPSLSGAVGISSLQSGSRSDAKDAKPGARISVRDPWWPHQPLIHHILPTHWPHSDSTCSTTDIGIPHPYRLSRRSTRDMPVMQGSMPRLSIGTSTSFQQGVDRSCYKGG